MQYQQINLNDFNELKQSSPVDGETGALGFLDLDAIEQRAHAARAAATLKGINGMRKAMLRLFA
ncbi:MULTISPECIES: hypothetical protein [unclassified Minwuia]|jgi:hypothetical protein|uniref:hypothetical protein n=1 Tax=unclassified Minwuia TaxID=2618799 RepID=UPI0024784DB6|nr:MULTISPECIES: hypothetical protein [unclassified Minwuia]